MADDLLATLRIKGHQAEQINIPFKWYPKEQIIRDCLVWKLIDISESYYKKVDAVIATKFPSYLVRHPRKIVWLAHQFREVYDCFGTHLSGFTETDQDSQIREAIFNWDTQALQETEKLFTISRNVSRRLFRYNGIKSRHLYVPPQLIGHYHRPEFNDYIFCPGRLEVSKRVDLLLRAMVSLPSEVHCFIAGQGPQEDSLRQLAEELHVADRVQFGGYISDQELLQHYSKAFAIYFAPYDEDLGLITLEAFQARKPVVTCNDSGAVLEFVDHEKTGLIADPVPENVARAIAHLFQNKKRCREMGEEGYQKIKYITWEYVIDNLLS